MELSLSGDCGVVVVDVSDSSSEVLQGFCGPSLSSVRLRQESAKWSVLLTKGALGLI